MLGRMPLSVPGRRLLAAVALPISIAAASPVIAATVAQPWHVVGESMEPVIEDGAVLLVDGLGPRLSGYRRGDIVVLSVPEGAARGYPILVKRIVGLPGDRVRIDGGRIALNGQELAEPYLAHDGARIASRRAAIDVVLAPDTVWVMGDHRTNSFDSTSFGPVHVGQLLGRVWFAVEPDGRLDATLATAAQP
jgi:signal peptidase I